MNGPPPYTTSGTSWELMGKDVVEKRLQQHYGSRRLHISADDDLDKTAAHIVHSGLGDFCWSLDFCEHFLRSLLTHGFLPICSQLSEPPDQLFVLLPKLHRKRCLLNNFETLHVDRGARKRSRRYHLVVDSAFSEVMQGCIEQHGESWLWPPMRRAMQDVFQMTRQTRDIAALHSIELRCKGKLVAGEIGYTCGNLYTSLTGFFQEKGSGTVQMLALAGLLLRSGVRSWDLGMGMAYKTTLGAIDVDREEFVMLQRQLRCSGEDAQELSSLAAAPLGVSASELIAGLVQSGAKGQASEASMGDSVNQREAERTLTGDEQT